MDLRPTLSSFLQGTGAPVVPTARGWLPAHEWVCRGRGRDQAMQETQAYFLHRVFWRTRQKVSLYRGTRRAVGSHRSHVYSPSLERQQHRTIHTVPGINSAKVYSVYVGFFFFHVAANRTFCCHVHVAGAGAWFGSARCFRLVLTVSRSVA